VYNVYAVINFRQFIRYLYSIFNNAVCIITASVYSLQETCPWQGLCDKCF